MTSQETPTVDEPASDGSGRPRAGTVRIPERLRKSVSWYEPADREAVLAFHAKMFGPDSRQANPDRFAWLYEGNPCEVPGAPRMFLARRSGEIIGHQGTIHFDLSIDGDVRPVMWGIDLIVEEKYHRRGAGAALMSVAMEPFETCCTLNVSEAGAKATLRFGFQLVGTMPVYVRPLDPRALAAELEVPATVRRLLPAAQPAVRASSAAIRLGARLAGLRMEEVDSFDARLGEVWERSAGDYRVLAVRDHRVTSWRIDRRPNRDEMRRYYLTRGEQTFGYVVLRRTRRAGSAMVVDYLSPRRWVAPLLTLAAVEAERWGAAALTCKTLNQGADRALRAAGFLRRDSVGEPPVQLLVHPFDQAYGPVIGDPRNWLLTSADGDLEPGVPSRDGDGS
jgi:predicted N-acetyltransferase YhbS